MADCWLSSLNEHAKDTLHNTKIESSNLKAYVVAFEFSLNVFIEFSEFSDKNIYHNSTRA